MESLIHSLSPLPANVRRPITIDRGTEFTAWRHLKASFDIYPWLCDPQSPWQKGTVENTNNRLRRANFWDTGRLLKSSGKTLWKETNHPDKLTPQNCASP